jgi:hypothetical protein
MLAIYPTILFIFELICYTFIFSSALYRYYKFKFSPDFYMGLGFVIIMLSSALRYIISFQNKVETATILFQLINGILVMPAVFCWFVGFHLYYKGEFNISVVLVGYLTGIIGGAFVFSNQVTVQYDNVTQNWNGIYPIYFFLLIVPLILIAFIRIIQPLLRRMNYIDEKRDKVTLLLMSFGVSLVLVWGITSAFTGIEYIRLFRPFSLPIGWLIWYLASQRNPFFLSVSTIQPLRIMITNSDGHLFFDHHFTDKTKTETKSELMAPLVQAINHMAKEVLDTRIGVKSYDVGGRKVISISIDEYYFHLISSDIDNSIISLFNYFSQNMINLLRNAPKSEYVNLDHEVTNYFNKLIIVRPEERVITLDAPELSN